MATPVKLLRLGKEMESGEVVDWLKSMGDTVQKGEPLFVVLTDKSEVEVESPATGVLLQVLVTAGEEAAVGSVVAWIGAPGEEIPKSPPSRSPAAPAARRLASQHSLSLDDVKGSGPGGLITPRDVESALSLKKQALTGTQEIVLKSSQAEVKRLRLSGIRKTMFERMTLSRETAAGVTTVQDVDMAPLSALKSSESFTYTAAVARAAALALPRHPILNTSLEGNEIVFHPQVHLGIAVDTSGGLRLVTLADADSRSLSSLNDELRRLLDGLKENLPKPASKPAPTFTLTNSGVLGSLIFTPRINPPQSAVLGMGKIQDTPVVDDGKIVIRPVMYLCLTYDHRHVEGAEAVRFLGEVKRLLEDPGTINQEKGDVDD